MKRMRLLNHLGGFGGGIASAPKITEITLADDPQPHVLSRFMSQSGIKHGQKVEGDLKNVRLVSDTDSQSKMPQLFFCPMDGFKKTREMPSVIDDRPLPEKVTLPQGLFTNNFVRKTGLYNIKGLSFYSNGSIQITATPETKFELVKEEIW